MMKPHFTCFALALLLAACQTDPSVTTGIDQAVRENQTPPTPAPSTPPAAVTDALLPAIASSNSAGTNYAARENRFDIAVKDAPAQDFFMGLVDGSPYNMLVQPGVNGKITLALKNVSIPEVMEAVRNVYGYDFSYHNGIYEVMPGGLANRVYEINYLNLKRMGKSRSRVNSGQLLENGNSGNNNNSNNSNSSGGTSNGTVQQIPSTEISTDTEADIWSELQITLRALIGEGDGRQVIVSPQAGMVVVRAPSRELAAVENFLNRAQLSLQRQVILEAKIIEVNLSDGFQSGINWAKLGSINGNPFNLGMSGVSPGGVTPTVPAGSFVTDGQALGGIFTGTYSSANFDGAIELLKTQGSVQVLSSPRVATINNQKAVIKVGSDEFFVTGISSNSTTNSSGNTNDTPTVTLTPFFSGIALDVLPQISATDEITLHVHPSVSRVVDQQKRFTVFGKPFDVPLALSATRESDTIVRAKNGQIVVIGGLMEDKADDRQAGAPGLADLPGIGYLFKQKRNSTIKSELVILLRPIVPTDQVWDDQVSKSRARFDELHPPMHDKFQP